MLPRRDLLSSGVLLSGGLWLPHSWAAGEAPPQDGAGRRVVITGANSGIGRDAALKLASRGWRVTLACRTKAKAEAAATELAELAQRLDAPLATDALQPAECDVASLASIRDFAAAQPGGVDRLLLNAGVQFSGEAEPRFTSDGFELSLGTNHLGHHLLASLLLPKLTADGRIVFTASEVHDPQSAGGSVGSGASLGDLSGLRSGGGRGMVNGGAFDSDKAYKDSKLCNMLCMRELARRLRVQGSAVSATAFGPGLITRTGFFRSQNPLFVALFDVATNDIFRVAESVGGGGDCLAFMATSAAPHSGDYYNNGVGPGYGQHTFALCDPSAEAQNDAKAAELWALSDRLVGISSA